MKTAWSGNWQGAIAAGLKRLGFANVTAFAKSRESATFVEFSSELAGAGVAPIQLIETMRAEICTEPDLQYFVRTTLVRYIRSLCPDGWKPDGKLGFAFYHAVARWTTILGKRHALNCRLITQRLKDRNDIPENWLPTSVSDPFLTAAFEGVDFSFRQLLD